MCTFLPFCLIFVLEWKLHYFLKRKHSLLIFSTCVATINTKRLLKSLVVIFLFCTLFLLLMETIVIAIREICFSNSLISKQKWFSWMSQSLLCYSIKSSGVNWFHRPGKWPRRSCKGCCRIVVQSLKPRTELVICAFRDTPGPMINCIRHLLTHQEGCISHLLSLQSVIN